MTASFGISSKIYDCLTAGTQRFRILKVLQQTPVVIAECEILEEKQDEEDSVEVCNSKDVLTLVCTLGSCRLTRMPLERCSTQGPMKLQMVWWPWF